MMHACGVAPHGHEVAQVRAHNENNSEGLMVGQGNPMAEDKAKLLRSLAIARSAARAAPRRWLMPVALGCAVVAALLVAAILMPQFRGDPLLGQAASQPAAGTPAPSSS